MAGKPLVIMEYLYVVAKEIGQVVVSDTKWKMSIPCSEDQDKEADTFKMQIELHEIELNKWYIVSVSRKGGSERTFKQFMTLYNKFKDSVLNDDQN